MTKSVPSLRDFVMPDAGRDLHQLEAMIFAYARAHDPAYRQAREAMERSLHWLECWDMRTADEQAREDIQSIRSALRAMGEGVGNG